VRKVEYVRDPQQGKQQKQRQRFYANDGLSIYTKASKSSFGNASASSAAVCKKTYSKITHDSTLSQSHNVFASNHQSDSDTPTLLPNTSQHCTVEAVAACHLASCIQNGVHRVTAAHCTVVIPSTLMLLSLYVMAI